LTQIPSRKIPADYRRIVLLNPTRYLGNLLIAGGLIQDFYHYCREREIEFLLVIDAAYRDLLQGSLPDKVLLFYPRKLIRQGSIWQKLTAYLGCLFAIRRFKADIAFNIEEDSVSHRLTQLSGASFRIGSNVQRHKHGYDHVLDINYLQRNAARRHRWYGYADVFAALGLPETRAGYLRLSVPGVEKEFQQKLENLGLDLTGPTVIIHAGAAKDYKKWPASSFAHLILLLRKAGYQSLLIGAGQADQESNIRILQELHSLDPELACLDLCNQFSLAELAILMSKARGMIGNDSGPFHLGSALGLPGCVIFGPTDKTLWPPLGKKSAVLKADVKCAAECTKTGCIYANRCLTAITAEQVMQRFKLLLESSD